MLPLESDIPGLSYVDNVDAIRASLPEVRVHVNLEVLGADVALRRQEHLDVLARGVENGGKIGRRHFDKLSFVGEARDLSKPGVLDLPFSQGFDEKKLW